MNPLPTRSGARGPAEYSRRSRPDWSEAANVLSRRRNRRSGADGRGSCSNSTESPVRCCASASAADRRSPALLLAARRTPRTPLARGSADRCRLQRRHRADLDIRCLVRRVHGGAVRDGMVLRGDRRRRGGRRAIRLFRGIGRDSAQHLHAGRTSPGRRGTRRTYRRLEPERSNRQHRQHRQADGLSVQRLQRHGRRPSGEQRAPRILRPLPTAEPVLPDRDRSRSRAGHHRLRRRLCRQWWRVHQPMRLRSGRHHPAAHLRRAEPAQRRRLSAARSSRSGNATSRRPASRPTTAWTSRDYAYVPAACEARQPCRVHVALHGCRQSHGDIGEDFVRHAGYNEWADTNRIIVLYPQIRAVGLTGLGITNPESCWDWWGYLDANPTEAPTWLLQSGRQIGAIKAMLDRITSGVVAPTAPATPPWLRRQPCWRRTPATPPSISHGRRFRALPATRCSARHRPIRRSARSQPSAA